MPVNASHIATPADTLGAVTPAEAGVQKVSTNWIPASAGMTAFMACARVTDADAFAEVTTFKACPAITAGPDFNRNIAP